MCNGSDCSTVIPLKGLLMHCLYVLTDVTLQELLMHYLYVLTDVTVIPL